MSTHLNTNDRQDEMPDGQNDHAALANKLSREFPGMSPETLETAEGRAIAARTLDMKSTEMINAVPAGVKIPEHIAKEQMKMKLLMIRNLLERLENAMRQLRESTKLQLDTDVWDRAPIIGAVRSYQVATEEQEALQQVKELNESLQKLLNDSPLGEKLEASIAKIGRSGGVRKFIGSIFPEFRRMHRHWTAGRLRDVESGIFDMRREVTQTEMALNNIAA